MRQVLIFLLAITCTAVDASAQSGGCSGEPYLGSGGNNSCPPSPPRGETGIVLCNYRCNENSSWDVVVPFGYTSCDSSFWGTLPTPCQAPVATVPPTKPPILTAEQINQMAIDKIVMPILDALKARYGIE